MVEAIHSLSVCLALTGELARSLGTWQCNNRNYTKVQVVQPYSSTDMAIAWKNSHFILPETSDLFHNIYRFLNYP